ncbi:Mycothiol acetyltransferase [Defluviimonas aquaemixtae]|uniref:Mycothiol acetyltransferase n=1 Tax=Albidovulum aquaemixtae TaxID=1542388 RepID=A0A2R8B6X2_9RHOB|nr:GNAT family N-acetyltransferase [Defluviimonas aquaemixtae]SPH18357.1 Mycothiol acetyltransferase [Defluviimonas aquaemixtae]
MLHRAGPEDIDLILPLVAAYHSHEGIASSPEARRAALAPLLKGSDFGAVWLIGTHSAPIGYIAITFGWSIEMGGQDAFVDEFFLVPASRGKGHGQAALDLVTAELKARGVRALHLEVSRDNQAGQRFYRHAGFEPREGYFLMSHTL